VVAGRSELAYRGHTCDKVGVITQDEVEDVAGLVGGFGDELGEALLKTEAVEAALRGHAAGERESCPDDPWEIEISAKEYGAVRQGHSADDIEHASEIVRGGVGATVHTRNAERRMREMDLNTHSFYISVGQKNMHGMTLIANKYTYTPAS
jgi:hypothetical protein